MDTNGSIGWNLSKCLSHPAKKVDFHSVNFQPVVEAAAVGAQVQATPVVVEHRSLHTVPLQPALAGISIPPAVFSLSVVSFQVIQCELLLKTYSTQSFSDST